MNRVTFALLLTALLAADCGREMPQPSDKPRAVPQAKRRAVTRPAATRSGVIYEGESGPGRGKHIVLIAGDREYRSEETIPALARILAKHHGFTCTVLFTIDPETGYIEPESSRSQISGLEALKTADLMVIFIRNQNYANDQMQHIVDYLDAGGPVVGLRTATHAFRIPKDSPYAKFSNRYRGESFKRGFGRQILGESWAGHYGKNHQQSTRIDLVNEQASHPILRGVKDAWVQSGGYFAKPMPNSTVLALAQPLNGMKPDSPVDETKKSVPTSWIRTYKSKSGRAGRVFTSTHGASEDILNDGYRRMLVNACFWAMGLEDWIKPDLATAFVGPYNPVTFRAFGHRQGVKPSDLAGWDSPIMSKDKPPGSRKRKPRQRKPLQKKDRQKQPNRNQKKKDQGQRAPTGESAAESLVAFRVAQDSAALPAKTAPAATQLPLKLAPGDHVVFIGNTLFDRAQDFGYFETLLQQRHSRHKLVVRTLAWSADEVDLQPRPANFGTLDQHLAVLKADVIFAAYGYNESFAGVAAIPRFRQRLTNFLSRLKSSAYNDKHGPRIVLVSPIANENVPGVDAATRNNTRLAAYTRAMAEVAAEQNVGFVDVFTPTRAAMSNPRKRTNFTFNGVHLEDAGYRVFAKALYRGVFRRTAPTFDESLRRSILEKNKQFHYRYRPVNSFYYVGGRAKRYGALDFFPAMARLDTMIANRDRRIWDLAQGRTGLGVIDDSNAPPLPPPQVSRGANKWLSPKDELAAFRIDPRFAVNIFASEEDFPELACPIQMRWDAKGRLWVSTSTTYPHVYPGNEPDDKILILEDRDQDGRADKITVFADGLHIPLSFEFGDGGLYVSEQPNLTFLKDTNGDGKADLRRKVLTGFGTEDSHHSLHDIVWTPDGDLMARDSIFLHSQVETPYGPVRMRDSGWYRFRPRTHRLVAFGSYRSTNPWGVTFDDWGQHMASHPVFASAFHALNAPYPDLHPRPAGLRAYSGTCGQEFVSMPHFPDEMQGGFIKVRYKPTNRVEFHRWVEVGAHYEEKYVGDIVFSTNLSFIPVDVRFGPRGALYVCDWYNPVKGHMQYSLRDKRRDRKSGRIWRITAKGRPLQDPPRIAGRPIPELLNILKRREYRYRYWAKRELRERNPQRVKTALDAWVAALNPNDPRFRHHQVEAIWMYRNIGAVNTRLLREVLGCEEHHARAAATRQLRYWHVHLPDAAGLLRMMANDSAGLVRLEAAVAASYIGTREALEAALDVLKYPSDPHLDYALACSVGSQPLRPHWQNGTLKERVTAFLERQKSRRRTREPAVNANHAQFDGQKDLKLVRISSVPERMKFTVENFTVRPGQPVKLVFTNPDATDHNLVIVKPGAAAEVGMAGNEMAKDPRGIEKHFIPSSKSHLILHATKLIGPSHSVRIDVLRFKAPSKPGVYPYICTFPGHWMIMRGTMVVRR